MSWKAYSCEEARKRWVIGMEWRVNRSGVYSHTPGFDVLSGTYWLNEPDPPQVTNPDTIKKPNHYITVVKGNEIDCWDVQEALGMRAEHYIASAFAYLWRCLKKGNTLEDLKKARAFIDREISLREKNNV